MQKTVEMQVVEAMLKPCPFCCSGAQIFADRWNNYSVQCTGCEARLGDDQTYGGEAAYAFDSLEDAMFAWNRREGI